MGNDTKGKNDNSGVLEDAAKIMKRLLNTPPKPHSEGVKDSLSESDDKKSGGTPVKKRRPVGS